MRQPLANMRVQRTRARGFICGFQVGSVGGRSPLTRYPFGILTGTTRVFKLRFPPDEIPLWAKAYSYPGEEQIVEKLAPRARARGHLTRAEFLALCRWKTPRSQPRCATNTAGRIREATQIALASTDEHAKIDILRSLAGVEWPTASVILHFCDKKRYPILDYRALWSLGFDKPPGYTFAFWWGYTEFTRRLARSIGQDMRILDRALWQFSKEHQEG